MSSRPDAAGESRPEHDATVVIAPTIDDVSPTVRRRIDQSGRLERLLRTALIVSIASAVLAASGVAFLVVRDVSAVSEAQAVQDAQRAAAATQKAQRETAEESLRRYRSAVIGFAVACNNWATINETTTQAGTLGSNAISETWTCYDYSRGFASDVDGVLQERIELPVDLEGTTRSPCRNGCSTLPLEGGALAKEPFILPAGWDASPWDAVTQPDSPYDARELRASERFQARWASRSTCANRSRGAAVRSSGYSMISMSVCRMRRRCGGWLPAAYTSHAVGTDSAVQ
jgi:hypothetical protein